MHTCGFQGKFKDLDRSVFSAEYIFTLYVSGSVFSGRINTFKFDLRKGQVENNGKKRTHV